MPYKKSVYRFVFGVLREFRLNQNGRIMDRRGYKSMMESLLIQMGKTNDDLRGNGDRDRVVNLLLERDGNICTLCGKDISPEDSEEIDHIVSWIDGGNHTADNIRLTHWRCNRTRPRKRRGKSQKWFYDNSE